MVLVIEEIGNMEWKVWEKEVFDCGVYVFESYVVFLLIGWRE